MAPNLLARKEKLEDFYDVKMELGRGHFAVVKKCISKATNEYVAAKFIEMKKTKTSRKGMARNLVEREADILRQIDHDKIIKLYDVFDHGTEMVLVIEYLCGGELFYKLCEQEYLTESEACAYMRQVIAAVSYLHAKEIVHLDIKAENIVLKSKDSTDIKLVDFGLARFSRPGTEIKEMMGTAEFVAPEIVNYDPVGFYSDMWSIGVLAYILLSGDSPFLGDNNQETFINISKADYEFDEEYWEDISDDAKLFIEELLVLAPSKRNTAKKCANHPWLTLKRTFDDDSEVIIKTSRLKSFLARHKWQESLHKMKAVSAFHKHLGIITDYSPMPSDNEADD